MNETFFGESASGGRIAAKAGLQESAIRLRIMEVLHYPRMLLVANMDGEDCPQNLFFNPEQKSCLWCRQGEECRWLNRNDDFSILAEISMKKLIESLLFCIDYVDAQSSYANHDVGRCACESCEWVNNARKLLSEHVGLNVEFGG